MSARGLLDREIKAPVTSHLEKQDFQEEEVWAVMKERERSSTSFMKWKNHTSSPCINPASSQLPRVVPRRVNSGGFDPRTVVDLVVHQPHHHHFPHQSSSAPLNIPDWSKIYAASSKKSPDHDQDDVDDHERLFADFAKCDEDGDDEDGEEMIPPHEFIARRLARSPIASFSMCEGIGRTLKGRDLSTLRNAILTKTGFLEQ